MDALKAQRFKLNKDWTLCRKLLSNYLLKDHIFLISFGVSPEFYVYMKFPFKFITDFLVVCVELQEIAKLFHASFTLRTIFVAVAVILQKQFWRKNSALIRTRVNSKDKVVIEKSTDGHVIHKF